MYYLRLVEDDHVVKRMNGTEVHLGYDDRAVFKDNRLSRFYRDSFGDSHYRLHLYCCKSMKRILGLRRDTYNYCGEIFDVWDTDGGKVELTPEQYNSYKDDD